MPQANVGVKSEFSNESKKKVVAKPESQPEITIVNKGKIKKVSINLNKALSIIVTQDDENIFKVKLESLPSDWAAQGVTVTVGDGKPG